MELVTAHFDTHLHNSSCRCRQHFEFAHFSGASPGLTSFFISPPSLCLDCLLSQLILGLLTVDTFFMKVLIFLAATLSLCTLRCHVLNSAALGSLRMR